ncbi:MAG: hypothetical protein GY839_10910 [candidate division Zixibacteria bacterium]|nr:hypothetical protein [candidate division Zixibacteria bacterium]
MKDIIRFVIIMLSGLSCIAFSCNCPFDRTVEFWVWTVSPEDGATIYTSEVDLVWSFYYVGTPIDTVHHSIYLGTSRDAPPEDWRRLALSHPETTITASSLEPATTYYWRVGTTVIHYLEPVNDERHENSDTASFTTADELWGPGRPHSPYPDSGAADVDSILEMYWSLYNPHDEIYDFDVYLGTTSDPALVQSGLIDTTRGLDTLTGETTYFWRVVSYNDKDTVEGPLWNFTTVAPILLNVSNPYPDNGATNIDTITELTWDYTNPGPSEEYFDLYIGTSSDPPLIVEGLTLPEHAGNILSPGTQYYWKVVIYNDVETTTGPTWDFTTRYLTGEEIFAFLEVDAKQAASGYHVEENIRARFDTAYAPVAPISPLQADSVFCEDIRLIWSAADQNYSYFEMSVPFVENGQPVDFTVYGNTDVPSLSTSIVFPACTLGITSPVSFETVSIDGFEIQWDGDGCDPTIWITILDGTDSTGVMKQTDNDGVDSLTASDLLPLGGVTGTYNLVIFKLVQQTISAGGYMPASIIRARAINVMEQIHIYGG